MTKPCAVGTFHGPLKDKPGHHAFARNDCKKLSCEHCGPRKAGWYRKRIVQHALEHGLTKFITLTLDPSKLSFFGAADESQQSVAYIRKTWAVFRVYLGRYAPTRNMRFIAVLELQGEKAHYRAHLHILTNRWIDQAWIDETWKTIGGGHTWIVTADIHRVAAYVSKYVTKELLLMIPKGKRRITTSRGMPLREPAKNPGWARTRLSIEKWAMWKVQLGHAILNESSVIMDDAGILYFEILDGQQSNLLDHSPPAHRAAA